ncbi:MAG TPA: hypothetical protein VIM65_04030 [Cyclobacteriaceae bacterium]
MKYFFVSFIAILAIVSISDAQHKLPKTWTKDFTIRLSYSGSMDGSSTHIVFTYDSCKYEGNSGMNAPKKGYYLMKDVDRKAILEKLQAFNVDKIHSEMSITPVNDGWNRSMCFGYHCIEAGTSAKISDHDKEQFSNAYDYLAGYAIQKIKK